MGKSFTYHFVNRYGLRLRMFTPPISIKFPMMSRWAYFWSPHKHPWKLESSFLRSTAASVWSQCDQKRRLAWNIKLEPSLPGMMTTVLSCMWVHLKSYNLLHGITFYTDSNLSWHWVLYQYIHSNIVLHTCMFWKFNNLNVSKLSWGAL